MILDDTTCILQLYVVKQSRQWLCVSDGVSLFLLPLLTLGGGKKTGEQLLSKQLKFLIPVPSHQPCRGRTNHTPMKG